MKTAIATALESSFTPRVRDRLRMIWDGLKSSADPGARRHARRELSHLLSLAVSLGLNVLVLVILISRAGGNTTPTPTGSVVTLYAAADAAPDAASPIEAAPPEATPPPDKTPPDKTPPDPAPRSPETGADAESVAASFASSPAAAFGPADAGPMGVAAAGLDLAPEPRSTAPRLPILEDPGTASHLGVPSTMAPGMESRVGPLRKWTREKNHGNDKTEDAVLSALRWLKEHQDADGAWRGGCPAAAGTGLALLSFLARGETPSSPEFGAAVRGGLQFLLKVQQPDGNFRDTGSHHAYGHAIATYALCEAVAMTQIVELREPAERAVAVIVRGQQAGGGWGYDYAPTRPDTSVMGWQIQALKAATYARLEVAGLDEALRKAGPGMRAQAAPEGGFGYTGPGNGPLTAAGTLCLQMLGLGRVPEAQKGLAILAEWTVEWETPQPARPLYHWYYCTQARFHQQGEAWTQWNNRLWPQLVRHQIVETGRDGKKIGHWISPQGEAEAPGPVYSTTLCTLMLEVYYRTLATFTVVEPVPEFDFAYPDDVGISVATPSA